jgi:hypothetical protein
MGKTETLTIENPQTANMPDTSRNPLTIREDKGSVLSMKSSASKSSSSTESGKFQSPEKKKQRPGTQKIDTDYGNDEIEDINMEELGRVESEETIPTDEDNIHTLNIDGDISQSDLDNITTDLESRYNSQNSADRCDES